MARSFNGSSDNLTNTTTSYLTIGTPGSSYSFGGWYYPASTSAGVHQGVMLAYAAGPNAITQLRRQGSDWLFVHNQFNGSLIVAQWTGGVTANQWFHIFGTYDGSNIRIYGNGTVQQTTAASGIFGTHVDTEIQFGSDTSAGGGGDYWDGRIGEQAIWIGVALTGAEISALANGARSNQIRPQSLSGWWPLDGLSSPEPDLSGKSKNLTLSGTALAAGPPVMMLTPRWPQAMPFSSIRALPPFNLKAA